MLGDHLLCFSTDPLQRKNSKCQFLEGNYYRSINQSLLKSKSRMVHLEQIPLNISYISVNYSEMRAQMNANRLYQKNLILLILVK